MLFELIQRGGPVVVVLLLCSLFSLAIILERAWFWYVELRRINVKRLSVILQEDLGEDKQLSENESFYRNVISLRKECDHEELSKTLRKESERAYERSSKFLTGLDTVVSIAPLLGILGTVMGIMKSFHALDLQHMTSPGAVGHGLAEAMITTAVGLSIAVPTLVFYNLFHSLAARHASSIYKLSEDLIDTQASEIGTEES